MTDAEKKMKNYTNAVERRLNLPRKVRNRVMSDFISSIQARREAGMSDQEIYEELGDPKQAAAGINAQMKDETYRKSPWRFLFAAFALYGAAELLLSLSAWILYRVMVSSVLQTGSAASVGIIGGADGPTAIFVTTPGWMHYINPVLCLLLGLFGYFRLRRCKQKTS